MMIQSYIKDIQPNIAIHSDFANNVMCEVERHMNAIGFDVSAMFCDQNLINQCEHQAWMMWLKYRDHYETAQCYLREYAKQERIDNNIEKNKNLMDQFFYKRLRTQSNRKRRRYAKIYERHSDICLEYMRQCHEMLVVAFCATKKMRRIGDHQEMRFSDLPSAVVRFSNHKVGIRIEADL